MSKRNQNYTNRKQNRFQPERMRGNVFVNNSGKQWLPGENGRAAKVERLLKGAKEEKKEIAGNMAGYKDSGVEWIGAIPKEWKFVPLKDSFYFVAGGTPLSNVLSNWDEGVAWVTPADFKTDKMYISKGARSLSKKGYQSCNAKMLPPGSIIFSKRAPIGSVAINTAELCTNQGCIGLLNKTKNANNKYFYYILSIATQTFEALGAGVTFKEISIKNFGNVSLPLPPIHEQQRIADFLDAKCGILDRTIDAVSRQIEDLEKYKKALITKTVTKGICKKGEPEREMKDSGVEWIGEVPEEWSVKRLKYVLDSIRNGAPAAAVEYSPELPRYVRITDIDDNGRLKETGKQSLPEDIAKRYMLDKEAVLIASVGSLGKTMLFNPDTEKEKCAFAGYLIETVTNPEAMNSKFLFYFIKSNAYMDWANRNFVQTTIQNLSAGRHKNLPVTVPPLAEQQQIADYLDEKCKNIDNRVQKRRQQLEWLKEYKKSLIFDYVTGKKRVEK